MIFTVASVLGSVACLSSLLLLWACLDSRHPGSLFHRMHLPSIPYGKIITMIYLKVHTPFTFPGLLQPLFLLEKLFQVTLLEVIL